MNYESILVEKRPPLAIISLNRPKALNALNAATFSELDAAFDQLGADSEVRVVLLTGAGERAFAAGADIRELDAVSPGEGKAFALRGQAVFRKIETLGIPVIACIRGFALGGGCELAMSCTLRIAADDAKFGQPEVKLGVIPGYGGSQRLPRLVGRGAALKLLLTGAITPQLLSPPLGAYKKASPSSLSPRTGHDQSPSPLLSSIKPSVTASLRSGELPLPSPVA